MSEVEHDPKRYHDETDADCAGALTLFRRLFPGVLLRTFRHFRREYSAYRKDFTVMIYEAHEDDLLAQRLLKPEMVAALPKRVRYGDDRGEDGGLWDTRRLARGRVVARVEVVGSPVSFLPALEPFAAEKWPWFESRSELREFCLRQRDTQGIGLIDATVRPNGALAMGCEAWLTRYGFEYHPDDRATFSQLTRKYRDDLVAAISKARIRPVGQPLLRIVE